VEAPDSSLKIAPKALDGRNRHICAFFTDMDEHYRVLQPFIKDGFDQGDKSFHAKTISGASRTRAST
jgi:hypothetical protein